MIAVRGAGSAIAKALIPLLPKGEIVRAVDRTQAIPTDAARYLFCAGVLHGKAMLAASEDELAETFRVNFTAVARDVDRLIAMNDRARIVVIGSESGFAGSFDAAYAGSKAALHLYVETKRLRTTDQQLVCVAPSIVGDSGMTERRLDRDGLLARERAHPKGRFLRAEEVARLIRFCLYEDAGYLSGTVIRMHGGERSCH